MMAEVWLNTQLSPGGTRPHGRSENTSFGEFSGEIRDKAAACSWGVTTGLRKGFVTLGNGFQRLHEALATPHHAILLAKSIMQ